MRSLPRTVCPLDEDGGQLSILIGRMDVIGILDRLNKWRSDWANAKAQARQDFLHLALDSCKALVQIEDVKSDEGVLLQERVRTLYRSASELLEGTLPPDELSVVVDALGSARIYYWIRFLRGRPGDEVEQLIRHRARIYGRLPSSLGIVDLALRAICGEFSDGQDLTEEALLKLRDGCLADFAKLEMLAARIRS
jgi:hypothetical protein